MPAATIPASSPIPSTAPQRIGNRRANSRAGDPAPMKKAEQRTSFITPNGLLVETVATPSGNFEFLVESQILPVKSVQHGDRVIEPPNDLKTMWETGLLRLPTGAIPYGTTSQLLKDIKHFICLYADLPEEWLEIISLYILMTWVFDRFTAVPYLRFLGEPGTGKTRLLQICSSISYKGTVASGNITGAALFRTIDRIRGTMAVDEADFKNSAEWSDITKVLNNGYSVGAPVIRCNKDSLVPEAYYVFGPKIISTRQRFEDEATETRCLTFETKERKLPAHIPLQLPLSFDREACGIRNKLLQWRFDNFRNIEAREEGMRGLAVRSGQIGASLAAVAPDEQSCGRLVSFLSRFDASRREESPKNVVIQALSELQSPIKTSATVNEVAIKARELAQERGLEEMTARKVGGILRSLGLTSHRTNKGWVVDLWTGEHPGVNK